MNLIKMFFVGCGAKEDISMSERVKKAEQNWKNGGVLERIGKKEFIKKYGKNSYKIAKITLKRRSNIDEFERRAYPSIIMNQAVGNEVIPKRR